MPTLAVGMSAFRYHKIDNRKNNIAIMFFRCEIQATDSTFTGCTANIKAAKNAPGMDNLRKTSQISNASAMCNNQIGDVIAGRMIPHSRHSIQFVVLGRRLVLRGFVRAPKSVQSVLGLDKGIIHEQ